jgi:hypothetical protein
VGNGLAVRLQVEIEGLPVRLDKMLEVAQSSSSNETSESRRFIAEYCVVFIA